ncbi:SIR2 family NAD-dependent protein deacylase [Pseudofulvibacter geojedonensis]|uniref:NAD-dependent protein deacylase n=1 Tax=Pseudofulvibacter geojedonensis TaxID=1123758 RepID=A0ABW3I013_9FLAO
MKKKLVVLSGAGMSAESGIATFRDANGLWEGHDIMEVASPEGFANNPELVLDFYNKRRAQLKEVQPNLGHTNLKKLEDLYNVTIVTQNVDDLHERAGSSNIIHLHGELRKVRSTLNESLIYNWEEDVNIGDFCELKSQLRPHIVWFGEDVPMIEKAILEVEQADILVIIGTSMQVYPAAGLVNYAPINTPIYFIDPNPAVNKSDFNNLTIIKSGASEGTTTLANLLSRA